MNLYISLLVTILIFENRFSRINVSTFILNPNLGNTDRTILSCSDFVPKKHFDMQKFLGTWLIVESRTERGDPVNNCMGVKISKATINGTFVMDIFTHLNGKMKSLLKQYVKNSHGDGYLDALTGSVEADQDYTIIETDYNHSALLLTCMDVNFDGITDLIEIDFLSRMTKLPDDFYQNNIAILENYGIDSEFVPVEQEQCP